MIEKEKRRAMKKERKEAWASLIDAVNQSTGSESTQDSQTVSNFSQENNNYFKTISGPSQFKTYDPSPYVRTASGPSQFKDFDKKVPRLMPTKFKTEANNEKRQQLEM